MITKKITIGSDFPVKISNFRIVFNNKTGNFAKF